MSAHICDRKFLGVRNVRKSYRISINLVVEFSKATLLLSLKCEL